MTWVIEFTVSTLNCAAVLSQNKRPEVSFSQAFNSFTDLFPYLFKAKEREKNEKRNSEE